MIRKKHLNFSILFILCGLSACINVNDFKNPAINSNWDPSFAIPLINSTLTIADAVTANKGDTNNIYLYTADGAPIYYAIRYRDTVFTLPANNLITFPGQNFSKSILPSSSNIIVPINNPLGTTVGVNFPLSFNNGMVLTYADIASGNLNLNLSTSISNTITVNINFPGLSNGVQNFSKTYLLNSNNSISDQIGLSGYTISLSPINLLQCNIGYTIPGGSIVSSSDQIKFSGGLSNVIYKDLVGNPGSFSVAVPTGQVKVGVFDQAISTTNISFVKPSIKVQVLNSFGVPASFSITELYSAEAYNVNNKTSITVDNTVFPGIIENGFNWTGQTQIGYPAGLTVHYSSPTVVASSYVIDSSNSNIRTVVSPAPKYIYYGTTLNLVGNSSDNYIREDSKFSVYTDVELPLYGFIDVYGLSDTSNINLPSQSNVDSVTIRLFTDNSIPVKLDLQGYFLDSLGHAIDSLVSFKSTTTAGFNTTGPVVAQPAIYDNNGDLVQSVQLLQDFNYTYARYAKIAKCKKLVLKGSFVSSQVLNPSTNTYTTQNFKITPAMKMTVKLSMKIALNVKL
jgi:hypothetical protein